MEFVPTRDRVVVEIKEAETKSKGGIIIPDTAGKDRPKEGIVIAVGKGKVDSKGKIIPMQVKKGDKIIYTEYAGNELEMNGKKLLILKEEEILAIQ